MSADASQRAPPRTDGREGRADPADDEQVDTAEFVAGVPTLSRAVTASAALISAAALASVPLAAAVGFLGALVVVAALRKASRRLLDVGVGALVAGSLAAGAFGAAVEPLLVAVAATLVAYDAGETGISICEQLGRRARSRRLVVARAATSVGFVAVPTAVAYGAFRLSTGAPSTAAVTLLVVGAFLVAAALR